MSGELASRRAALEAEILAWMREPQWREDEARFDGLARRLHAFQVEACPPYRRFCEGRGRLPERVSSWREIPPVPTGAFKEVALRCFPPERTRVTFRTSGTSTQARGSLHLDTLELYEASLLASFRRHLLPEGQRQRILVLAAAPSEAPDSSLSHMFGIAVQRLGSPDSGFYLRDGELELLPLVAALEESARRGEPVLLCGTAFSFVHLLDELSAVGARVRLPPGSRIMETGGFKGRSRELPREELYAALEAGLDVPPGRIVNQYGMTELGSQFYDSVLLRPAEPRRKLAPPWTRVSIIDPGGGEATGGVGCVVVVDLANTGSVLAVQTADLGRPVPGGFVLLGRQPGAEARGCSIAVDELLAS